MTVHTNNEKAKQDSTIVEMPAREELLSSAIAKIQGSMAAELRNVVLGQASVMHHSTLAQIASLDERLAEAVRIEVQRAFANLHAGIISEVRNIILGQANVTHHLTVGELNSVHDRLLGNLQQIAARIGEIQHHSTTRLMTTDLTSELLCLIDLKHQQLERALDDVDEHLETTASTRADALEIRISKLDMALEQLASHLSIQSQRPERQFSVLADAAESHAAGQQELSNRMDQLEARAAASRDVVRRLELMENGIAQLTAAVQAGVSGIASQLRGFEQTIATGNYAAQMAGIDQKLDQMKAAMITNESELLRGHIGEPVGALTQPVADFLNWATGHRGYASQNRLWVNHALHPTYCPGDVKVTYVNERVVELPFALEHLATLPKASRVIDLGSTESLLALMIATLGHEVYAVDFRSYAVQHPGLRTVEQLVETWEGPAEKVDAIFCISALEHVGVGAYGDTPKEGRVDLEVCRRFRDWLKPSGLLVFTAPYGPRSIDALQRTYNSEDIAELFEGWTILERRYYQASPERYWAPASAAVDEGPPETKAVILLTARC